MLNEYSVLSSKMSIIRIQLPNLINPNIMSNQADFITCTNNWQQEPVVNLANHFHRLNPGPQQQQVRLRKYLLNTGDLMELKQLMQNGTIQTLDMYLGLTGAADNNTFTSCFYIHITYGANSDLHKYFKLEAGAANEEEEQEDADPLSDLVPKIFKEMIATNWYEMGFSEIDDLFVAKQGTQLLRVNFFWICQQMIDFMNTAFVNCADNIEAVTIYAGVDLNKFSNKETVSFTPVLGIQMPEEEITTFKEAGIMECLKKEIFVEYSMPCPPTCNPATDNS
jgi:hypothetical protein